MSIAARYERIVPARTWTQRADARSNPVVLGAVDVPDDDSPMGQDWAIYVRPIRPELWWPTVDECTTQTMRFAPWKLRINDNPGEGSRLPIPACGIAAHVAAAQLRVEIINDEPYTFNMEVPPPSFEGGAFALWARPGRPVPRTFPLGHFQTAAAGAATAQTAPLPAFATAFRPGAFISGQTYQLRDRTGAALHAPLGIPAVAPIDWRAVFLARTSGTAPMSITVETFQ